MMYFAHCLKKKFTGHLRLFSLIMYNTFHQVSWTLFFIFSVFTEFITVLLLSCFWSFGHEACEIFTPWPRIKLASPVLDHQRSPYTVFKLMYNWPIRAHIQIWYFYTTQNDHHDVSSYHLSPFKGVQYYWLYSPCCTFSPPWLIYFVTGSLSL